MKRVSFLFLSIILLGSFVSNSQAQFGLGIGIGIHGGTDRFTIPSLERSVKLMDLTQVSVIREEVKNPIMGGIDLFINTLPIIDLQISVDGSKTTYPLKYIRPNPTVLNPLNQDTTRYDVPFGRVGLYVSVKKNLIAIPPILKTITLYAGLGAGAHYIAPLVSEKYIYDHLKTKAENLDAEGILKDDIAKEIIYGGHALVGLRLKVPIFPIQVFGEGKLTIVPAGKYEQPSKFFSVYAGLAYML
ncbi:MAG: hypothetical protein GXO76_09505 [Calditrichaeota bacterium]|nr:hypothetical protein [Calditrichota bacterium]